MANLWLTQLGSETTNTHWWSPILIFPFDDRITGFSIIQRLEKDESYESEPDARGFRLAALTVTHIYGYHGPSSRPRSVIHENHPGNAR
jgi:hypothetical protein